MLQPTACVWLAAAVGAAASVTAPRAKCPVPMNGTDFLNTDDQTNHPASSYEECCTLCQKQNDCKAFVFRSDQKKCWMKAEPKNPVPQPLAQAGTFVPAPPPPGRWAPCFGEFTPCSGGSCSMSDSGCGVCQAGQYLCPTDQKTCVDGVDGYTSCPNLKGTHLDNSLDPEDRLDYLVAHTNLTEQIGQLQNKAPEITHLGIPAYNWLNDDQHGVARTSAPATVLPNGCGMGATFSKATLYLAGKVVGEEARGLHNMFLHNQSSRGGNCNGCGITAYAPNLNLVRDPRWGRGQETFGEDPHHMARLVVAYVTGAQDNAPGAKVGPDGKHMRIGMCCKHFAAYDLENVPSSRQTFNTNLSSADMWYTYMPAFQACIQEAQATHVMCSYNSVEGVPTCGSKGLLTEILREQWNWDGFVVSDYDAWANILNTHHYVDNMEDAAAVGINAGLDQEGGGTKAISELAQAVADGKVSKETVATAFRRLFRIRIRLGMLDPPASMPLYNGLSGSQAQSAEHLNITRRTALEGMTLLKNAKAALPLDATKFTKPGSLAVIGGQATMAGLLMGNYAESAANGNWGTDVLDAVTARVGNNASVAYAAGCPDPNCDNTDGFAAAVAVAKNADAVIVTLGLWFNKGGAANEAEGHDRSVIELPGHQNDLVTAIRAAVGPSTPVIGLLIHGGTLALGDANGQLDAIISAWYPGLEGGHAIAQTLFGDYSPAGRTPVTWYSSTDVLPPPGVMDESAGGGVTYRYFKDYQKSVVYPFGFGLSYTTFSYTNLAVNATTVAPCEAIGLTVAVSNTGTVDSDEVVQAYLKTPNAAEPAPRVRLVAFDRVFVPAGKTVTVSLTVSPDMYSLVDPNPTDIYKDTRSVSAGTLALHVGGGQPDYDSGTLATTVTVSGPTKALSQC